MLERFIDRLHQLDSVTSDLDAEQIADMLWLAWQLEQRLGGVDSLEIDPVADQGSSSTSPPSNRLAESRGADLTELMEVGDREPTTTPLFTAESLSQESASDVDHEAPPKPTLPYRAAAAPSLRNPLAIERSLRPLRQRVPSRSMQEFDEVATAERLAETGTVQPVLQPVMERRWDVALVVEETSLSDIWQKPVAEFQQVLGHLGAFRDLRLWTVRRDGKSGKLGLFPRLGRGQSIDRLYGPETLVDPTGRRLILLVSDCTSSAWWSGQVHDWLRLWSVENLVTVVQLLPDYLWEQGVLGEGWQMEMRGTPDLVNNGQLIHGELPDWLEVEGNLLKLPVVSMGAAGLRQWAKMLVGQEARSGVGVLFDGPWQGGVVPSSGLDQPDFLVRRFFNTASLEAQQLVRLMAAAPVSVRVAELLQETLLRRSDQVHVAEVWMSGLVRRLDGGGYDFGPGVRDLLLDGVPKSEMVRVLDAMSRYVGDRIGSPMQGFAALLAVDLAGGEGEVMPFAEVALTVLDRLGEEYRDFAARLRQRMVPGRVETGVVEVIVADEITTNSSVPFVVGYPRLQAFDYEVVTIDLAEAGPLNPPILGDFEPVEVGSTSRFGMTPKPFEFEIATIEIKEKDPGLVRRVLGRTPEREIVIKRNSGRSQQVTEPLASGLGLEMVQIPAGSFFMGSSESEKESLSLERPRHWVKVAGFWMGKYAVTQAQWRFVEGLPVINCEFDADPSRFKGDNRPVEQVSWLETVEFCRRLSVHTGRLYRLPSEAEWEYACRAGTTTPFHFGETIDGAIANYCAKDRKIDGTSYPGKYGRGRFGEYREQTTTVGSFMVANAFGLYDMHGNVWEWCADHWNANYQDAPVDGSVWLNGDEKSDRVARGGSWINLPRYCRSAYRDRHSPVARYGSLGFRVVSFPQGSS